MTRVLGIDLGTTNSAMAVFDGSKVVIVPNAEGDRTTPSNVSLRSDKTLVGKAARNQAIVYPKETITSVKRLMGKKYEDVTEEALRAPYEIVGSKDGRATVSVNGELFSPEMVSSLVLKKMKADAETILQEELSDAVIAVPAYFDEEQREATERAARMAGLNVVQLLDEPNASALVYGLDQGGRTSRVLVFDLGGGTCDVSVLEVSTGTLAVCALAGDNNLGGDDWDCRIVDWLAEGFFEKHRIDLREDPKSLRRLRDAAEQAKIELSDNDEAVINLPFIAKGPTGPLHVDVSLTRVEFEGMTRDLLARCRVLVEEAVARAGLDMVDMDEVVMVGGSVRMPAAVRLLRDLTGIPPRHSINPDEAVALGAALQGAVKKKQLKGSWLLDATALAPEFRVYAQGVLTTSGWWKEPF